MCHKKWSVGTMSAIETHLYQSVTLAFTTETIGESWAYVTMKQKVIRVSRPLTVQFVSLPQLV